MRDQKWTEKPESECVASRKESIMREGVKRVHDDKNCSLCMVRSGESELLSDDKLYCGREATKKRKR